MSNPANYSPYNKTFKFLLFQNQAYHQRNKINIRPCVRTNLRYKKNNIQLFCNPQKSQRSQQPDLNEKNTQTRRSGAPNDSTSRSFFLSNRDLIQRNPQILSPKRVIHKNQSFQKFNNLRVKRQNTKMVNRLVSTSCQVLKRDNTQKSFTKHLKFREIRKKYDSQGKRKHGLVVGNHSLLCPTLKEYNQGGLASRFVERNLSWIKGSTTSPKFYLKKRNSNFV